MCPFFKGPILNMCYHVQQGNEMEQLDNLTLTSDV